MTHDVPFFQKRTLYGCAWVSPKSLKMHRPALPFQVDGPLQPSLATEDALPRIDRSKLARLDRAASPPVSPSIRFLPRARRARPVAVEAFEGIRFGTWIHPTPIGPNRSNLEPTLSPWHGGAESKSTPSRGQENEPVL